MIARRQQPPCANTSRTRPHDSHTLQDSICFRPFAFVAVAVLLAWRGPVAGAGLAEPSRQGDRPLRARRDHRRDRAAGRRSLCQGLGQPFVVENRGGAGGAIGPKRAARAPKDGYTIYLAGGAPITSCRRSRGSYDPVKDFAPVGMITRQPDGVHGSSRHSRAVRCASSSTTSERTRAKINYSVGGNGSSSLSSPRRCWPRANSSSMVAVPYQSMPPAVSALLAGTVQMFFGNISDFIEPVRSGKVRLAGVVERQAQPAISRRTDGRRDRARLQHDRLARRFRRPRARREPIIVRLSRALQTLSRDPRYVKILGNARHRRHLAAPPDEPRAGHPEPILCYTRRRSKRPACYAQAAAQITDTGRRTMSMVSTR